MIKKTLFSLALSAALTVGYAHAADITIAYDADPESMDPMEQISEGTLQMASMVYDPLLRYDSKLNIEPRLAESWEFPDDQTVRFHLRKGVKFHSGNDMTADDVVFSFNRLKKSIDFKGLFEPYDAMNKVDDYTVDLIMNKPYPLVLPNMSYLFVMDKDFFTGEDSNGKPKDAIEKAVGTFASMNESGSGPFILESRQHGVKSVYKKFPDYWDKDTGNVDQVTLVPIKENATRVSALLSGDVDWIYPVPPADADRVQNENGIAFHAIPSDRIILIQMNKNVTPEFADKRVRQAVVNAVNNQGIVDKIMRGNATTAAQLSPEGYQGYNPNLTPRYDLDKAKELMKEAGQENGFTTTMISPNNRYINDEKIAQTVAAMLSKINIKANLSTSPKAQYFPNFDKCDAGLQLYGWSSDTGDSANYSEYITYTRSPDIGLGQKNCSGYSNPELDELLQAAAVETDEAKRRDILQKVSQIEYDDAIYIPLHWQNQNWAYSNRFENFPEVVNLKNFPHWEKLHVSE